ncbi:MAG: hypothetical protein MK102_19525, partial [Fuerstiella sp.]|nr:hypothetical protein [Fuerstiella sp.]
MKERSVEMPQERSDGPDSGQTGSSGITVQRTVFLLQRHFALQTHMGGVLDSKRRELTGPIEARATSTKTPTPCPAELHRRSESATMIGNPISDPFGDGV